MKRVIYILICSILVISIFTINCFALSSSTYADLSPTASQVQNLVSIANNYKDFLDSDFVVFQDSQYSYRIAWGDKIDFNNNSVTSDSVSIVSYVRSGSGYDYSWVYEFSNNQSLSLTYDHLVVSNIQGLGASSPTYEQYSFYHNIKWLVIFSLAFLGVLMFLAFRRTFR